jgi:hypothetical protein
VALAIDNTCRVHIERKDTFILSLRLLVEMNFELTMQLFFPVPGPSKLDFFAMIYITF